MFHRKSKLLFIAYFTFYILSSFNFNLNAQPNFIELAPNHSLGLAGYFRSLLGQSEGGKTAALFQAPGARAKYRLGNEPNTYVETEIDYRYSIDSETKKSIDMVIMLAGFSNLGDQSSFKLDKASQLYVRMNNIIGDTDFWMGKKYYQRKDYHIMDYFWYNPGQESTVGVGVKGLRSDQYSDDIAIALFAFEADNVKELNPIQTDKTGVLQSYILDVKWDDIPVNTDGKATIWGQLSSRNANEDINFSSKTGFAIGLWHNQSKLLGGKANNNFQTSFRKGLNISQNYSTGNPVYENFESSDIIGYNMNKAYAVEVSNSFLYEQEKEFAINWVILYRSENRGVTPYNIGTGEKTGNGKYVNWFSSGFRAYKYLTKNFNLALEAGADYVDNQSIAKKGWLSKITFSPQLSWNYGFYSRPVIRPFITYAFWSNDFKGYIGNTPNNAPFGDKSHGLTFGIHLETWW